MHSVVWSVAAVVLMSTLACSSGVDYVPSTPSPTPPPPSPPPPPPRTVVEEVEISIGGVIHDTVSLTDPVCDPVSWDATAPCKRFVFLTPRDGMLEAFLSAPTAGPHTDVVDLLILCPGSRGYGGLEQHVAVPVSIGQRCSITVNLYPGLLGGRTSLDFELRTQL